MKCLKFEIDKQIWVIFEKFWLNRNRRNSDWGHRNLVIKGGWRKRMFRRGRKRNTSMNTTVNWNKKKSSNFIRPRLILRNGSMIKTRKTNCKNSWFNNNSWKKSLKKKLWGNNSCIRKDCTFYQIVIVWMKKNSKKLIIAHSMLGRKR